MKHFRPQLNMFEQQLRFDENAEISIRPPEIIDHTSSLDIPAPEVNDFTEFALTVINTVPAESLPEVEKQKLNLPF